MVVTVAFWKDNNSCATADTLDHMHSKWTPLLAALLELMCTWQVSFMGMGRGVFAGCLPLRVPTIHTHNIYMYVESSPLINITSCLNRMFCSSLHSVQEGAHHPPVPTPWWGALMQHHIGVLPIDISSSRYMYLCTCT